MERLSSHRDCGVGAPESSSLEAASYLTSKDAGGTLESYKDGRVQRLLFYKFLLTCTSGLILTL